MSHRNILLVALLCMGIFALTPVVMANTTIPVCVDIKPASCPNPLQLMKKGVLPVAIYGTESFDVTTIDPETIRLQLTTTPGVHPLRWSYEDVDGEGHPDLTLKFHTQEVINTLGLDAFSDGDVVVLTLTGNLKAEFGSTSIQGLDVIVILDS